MFSTQHPNSNQVRTWLELPPLHVLEEHFEYQPWTGKLLAAKDYRLWREGLEVGWSNALGYRQVRLHGKSYYVHRIIWVIIHGEISPHMEVDHIDGNPSNNAIYNLRLVTASQNARNQKLHRRNTTGVQGISTLVRADGSPKFILRMGGTHLGVFDTLEAAAQRRLELAERYGFHPNHGRAREAA